MTLPVIAISVGAALGGLLRWLPGTQLLPTRPPGTLLRVIRVAAG